MKKLINWLLILLLAVLVVFTAFFFANSATPSLAPRPLADLVIPPLACSALPHAPAAALRPDLGDPCRSTGE